MIAALYVETNGCYYGLPNVDPWDRSRDARLYAGQWAVVAHPPCERWGRYSNGGPSWLARNLPPKIKGDDGGCFEAALAAVRRWGGELPPPNLEIYLFPSRKLQSQVAPAKNHNQPLDARF